jgi:hypothetical protein
MKTVAKELICLDVVLMSQSNAINSSFASNPGWKGLANSMKVNYLLLTTHLCRTCAANVTDRARLER